MFRNVLLTSGLALFLSLPAQAHLSRIGVTDSGGGEIKPSSRAEVIESIETAWEMATVIPITENLISSLQFIIDIPYSELSYAQRILKDPSHSRNYRLAHENELHLRQQLDQANTSEDSYYDYLEAWITAFKVSDSYRHAGSALSESEIEFQDICYDANGEEKDATVSEHRLGATICFSIERLTRIPRASLVREILGLIVHEWAHVLGEDEDVANEMQEFFMANIDKLLT
jgi:hypothetical protein